MKLIYDKNTLKNVKKLIIFIIDLHSYILTPTLNKTDMNWRSGRGLQSLSQFEPLPPDHMTPTGVRPRPEVREVKGQKSGDRLWSRERRRGFTWRGVGLHMAAMSI